MLNSALIRRPGITDGRYDIGRVLDTVLFYQHVHLVLDLQFLDGLADSLGIAQLRRLLALPHVTSDLISPEMCGVHTDRSSGLETLEPVYIYTHGQKVRSRSKRLEALQEILSRRDSLSEVKVADLERMFRRSHSTQYVKLLGDPIEMRGVYDSLLDDPQTVRLAIARIAARHGFDVSEKLADFEFEFIRDGVRYIPSSEGWEKLFGYGRVPPEFGWAGILNHLHEYAVDLRIAATNSSDIILSEDTSEFALKRMDLALRRAVTGSESIMQFQESAFEGRGLGEAVNHGDVSVGKAIDLIERSGDVRAWLGSSSPSSTIVGEYVRAMSERAAMDGVAPSLLRFFGFSGAGAALGAAWSGPLGALAGLGVSAFDQFVVGKLANGWRPSTFVNRVKRVLRSS